MDQDRQYPYQAHMRNFQQFFLDIDGCKTCCIWVLHTNSIYEVLVGNMTMTEQIITSAKPFKEVEITWEIFMPGKHDMKYLIFMLKDKQVKK